MSKLNKIILGGTDFTHYRLSELVNLADSGFPFYLWVEKTAQSLFNNSLDLNSQLLSLDKNKIKELVMYCFLSGEQNIPKLFDGKGEEYGHKKACFYFFSWIVRDAPQQRLSRLISEYRSNSKEKLTLDESIADVVAELIYEYRSILKTFEWSAIREVFVDRLEGSGPGIHIAGLDRLTSGRLLLKYYANRLLKLPLDLKNKLNYLKHHLRVSASDYTFLIYFVKIFGYVLTSTYFAITLFDKKKTKEFNKKRNYFVLKKVELINKYNKPADDQFNKQFSKNGRYDFNGIYLPIIGNVVSMRSVYQDSLKIYTEKGDNYSYKIVDEMEKTLPEGSYCYVGPQGEDITIKPGYTVLDAGAWIGDFSAYASKKGAHAYAFEPSSNNIKFLEKTVEYNKGNGGQITIVPYGLGDKEEDLDFFENDDEGNTGANTFNIPSGKGNTRLHITTVDAFVNKYHIDRVDFIKSDIEGYERLMLKGAEKTLKKYGPILSICTYHYSDDPQVLKDIILKANPRYNIIQRKMKLFAYIKKD